MQSVRVLELPCIKAAYSGLVAPGSPEFLAFIRWFSELHSKQPYELFPRDFLRFHERKNGFEWFYALPCDANDIDCGGYDVVDLPGGLFAVGACIDGDFDQAADWLDTRQRLTEWAQQSTLFAPYENAPGQPERYPMFTITSPHRYYARKLSLEDLYLPIIER